MTTTDLNRYRKLLETRAADLERSTRQRDGILVERTADALDDVLRAVERELALVNLAAGNARLREVREALARIENGTYGTCLECEEAISPARLAALPWAALCIHCQQAAQSRFGGQSVRPVFDAAA
jgi:DnaK suppressor protein